MACCPSITSVNCSLVSFDPDSLQLSNRNFFSSLTASLSYVRAKRGKKHKVSCSQNTVRQGQ